jgi:hypothetical protein
VDSVEAIAAAVLYEGYVLWPYRRSATKNQKRWTLGGVCPRAYSEASGGDDPWLVQTQCLVIGTAPVVRVKVRFLQVVERQVLRKSEAGTFDSVDELRIGGDRFLTWDEATEREVSIEALKLAELETPRLAAIEIAPGSEEKPLAGPDGEVAGALVRSWHALLGAVELRAETVREAVWKLTVRIMNTTPWSGQDRERTLRQSFVSAHTILQVGNGEFISLTDPPGELKLAAESCENLRTWPVLAGEEAERDTILSSPIVLYDYPRIAPESRGDLFDATEIDQLLMLNILTLTDEEKEEMRASDPRAREILERSEAFTRDDFMSLHGAIREFRTLRPEADLFAALEGPVPESVTVGGVEIRKGSKVRLRPRPGGDIMDLALAGKVAFVEAIEQDFEDRVHLVVTVEDDPGRDLGQERQIGHRFFFAPEEVEWLGDEG